MSSPSSYTPPALDGFESPSKVSSLDIEDGRGGDVEMEGLKDQQNVVTYDSDDEVTGNPALLKMRR